MQFIYNYKQNILNSTIISNLFHVYKKCTYTNKNFNNSIFYIVKVNQPSFTTHATSLTHSSRTATESRIFSQHRTQHVATIHPHKSIVILRTYKERFITNVGIKTWNDTPNNIKTKSNISLFSNHYFRFLLNSP